MFCCCFSFSLSFAAFPLTYTLIPSICFISLLRVLLWVLLFMYRIISLVLLHSVSVPLEQLFPIFFLPHFAKVHFSPPEFALYLGSNWEAHYKSLFAVLNIHMVLTGHRCNRKEQRPKSRILAVPGPGVNRVSVYLGAVQSSQNVYGVRCFCWVTMFRWTLWPEVTFFVESFFWDRK